MKWTYEQCVSDVFCSKFILKYYTNLLRTNMEKLNRKTANITTTYPERIIQFGEGNFLRAFVDWMVYNMNKKADFNSRLWLS